jgi:hypothetical protein
LSDRFPDLVELRATEETVKAAKPTWLTLRRRGA